MRWLWMGLALATAAGCPGSAAAQSYTLARRVLGNGASASSGAGLRLTGTIGQAVVGTSSGASLRLCHGYWYRGVAPTVGVEQSAAQTARLGLPVPNPSSAGVSLTLSLASEARVELTIHDISGRRRGTLVSGTLPAGLHRLGWSGPAGRGAMSAGVYFARLVADGKLVGQRSIVIVR
jgi:hypothetical protein